MCFQNILAENAEQRHKIAIHVVSVADGKPDGKVVPDETNGKKPAQAIQDVTVFKSCHGMHPLVQPYISITRKGNKSKL